MKTIIVLLTFILSGIALFRIGLPVGDDFTFVVIMTALIPFGLPVWLLAAFWKHVLVLLVAGFILSVASSREGLI